MRAVVVGDESHTGSKVQKERGVGRGSWCVSLSICQSPVACSHWPCSENARMMHSTGVTTETGRRGWRAEYEWQGAGGMKIVYSLNKYFFNWLLCSRHWAKCTWHVKLCLGFASRSIGHRSRGNFFLLEYYFYLQRFNRDSSVWIRLQWGLLPFASVCHST